MKVNELHSLYAERKKVMDSLQTDSVQVFLFIYGLNPKVFWK